jgi:hypothetical protein
MNQSDEDNSETKEAMERRLIELVNSLYVEDDCRDDQVEVLPEDLEHRLQSPETLRLLKTIEMEWRRFLRENPHLRPRGGRATRKAVLESKLRDTISNQAKAEFEMQRQLDFFQDSREALENDFAVQVEEAESIQYVIQNRIDQQLDRIALSDHLMQQIVRYETFLETVDIHAVPYLAKSQRRQESQHSPSSRQQEQFPKQEDPSDQIVLPPPTRNQGIEPSARAMALIDPNGDDDDVRLRAFRMDHALYCAELQILEKESERIQLNNQIHAFVGKFLTEHNIWGILNKQQQQQQEKKPASLTKS